MSEVTASTITDEQLTGWARLAEHAASWELDGFSDGDSYVNISVFDGPPSNPRHTVAQDITRHDDAAAIEMVTTAVPALLAEVNRLRSITKLLAA